MLACLWNLPCASILPSAIQALLNRVSTPVAPGEGGGGGVLQGNDDGPHLPFDQATIFKSSCDEDSLKQLGTLV